MKLYLGNLPFQASEADIEGWFAGIGVTVDSVSLIRDKFSGQARGFGFAEIADRTAAEAAIRSLNGKEFKGRAIVVNEARPMEKRESRAGGGGGGRSRESRGGSRW